MYNIMIMIFLYNYGQQCQDNLNIRYMYIQEGDGGLYTVDKPDIDGSCRTQQAMSFGLDVACERRHLDVELLKELEEITQVLGNINSWGKKPYRVQRSYV